MGINGLLQQLKSISRPTHVSAYRSRKVSMCCLAGAHGCHRRILLAAQGSIQLQQGTLRVHMDRWVLRVLRFNGTTLPLGYDLRFQRTIWLFRHQRVFCHASRALTHLRPLPAGGLGASGVLVLAAVPPEGPELEALGFLGPPMEQAVAAGIADGDLDPSTLQPFDLASIYRDCPNPPHHLRPTLARLLPPPAASQHHSQRPQQSQQQQHHQQQGQRLLSWGPGTQQRDSQAGLTQEGTQGGRHGHHPHHGTHHGHHHGHHGHRRGAHGHGRPPAAPLPPRDPDKGIKRFFKSDPAASQPYRVVAPKPLGGGGGSQAAAAGAGGGAAVVTLRGLAVEVLTAAGGSGGREGGGCGEEEAGGGEVDERTAAGSQEADGEADERSPPSAKRRRRHVGGADGTAAAGFGGGTAAAAAAVAAGGGAGASRGSSGGAAARCPLSQGGGSLFAQFKRGASGGAGGGGGCGAGLPTGGRGAGDGAGRTADADPGAARLLQVLPDDSEGPAGSVGLGVAAADCGPGDSQACSQYNDTASINSSGSPPALPTSRRVAPVSPATRVPPGHRSNRGRGARPSSKPPAHAARSGGLQAPVPDPSGRRPM
ncbi:Exonuclease 1 [Tetrabaena socialis]|uniref:Exonuclease 1 n=1 Tax=Tetrabaena socialis TaxID=47790 RepID=A0A2J8AA19_9CHLO|nr:Exonuclease 1 [Tetrabaena socialis]|eukprot:PNH09345.1 Exonuclease 1 [Tetrabaena socialis]